MWPVVLQVSVLAAWLAMWLWMGLHLWQIGARDLSLLAVCSVVTTYMAIFFELPGSSMNRARPQMWHAGRQLSALATCLGLCLWQLGGARGSSLLAACALAAAYASLVGSCLAAALRPVLAFVVWGSGRNLGMYGRFNPLEFRLDVLPALQTAGLCEPSHASGFWRVLESVFYGRHVLVRRSDEAYVPAARAWVFCAVLLHALLFPSLVAVGWCLSLILRGSWLVVAPPIAAAGLGLAEGLWTGNFPPAAAWFGFVVCLTALAGALAVRRILVPPYEWWRLPAWHDYKVLWRGAANASSSFCLGRCDDHAVAPVSV